MSSQADDDLLDDPDSMRRCASISENVAVLGSLEYQRCTLSLLLLVHPLN